MKMSLEPEEEESRNRHQPPAQHPRTEVHLMDLDFDLDASWPLDQIFAVAAVSNPSSPFLMSQSEQPCSPLWAFPDEDNNDRNLVSGGSFRFSQCSRIAPYSVNPNVETDRELEKTKKKNLASPFTGSMPIHSLDASCIIKERMTQALRYFKDLTEQHILAQMWVPVKSSGHYVLTTSGQPFVLDPSSNGLHQYRLVSLMYLFNVDGDTNGVVGLPGRVFRQKLPEWTPNVQYYSSKEFSRLNHALNYNIRGTLALPVFEPNGQSCLGVLELIMTDQKINYAPDVDKVCKALEAVNLKSSDVLDHQSPQICNVGRQNALAEILEILTIVCETHKLPLAQTWVPCMHRSVLANGGGFKKTCSSFDGSCMGQVCMSTTDVAVYVVDAHLWGFREACAEHHLMKGQGVAGRAFSSHNSCFCQDITEFCKTEYPLVHYAKLFGLRSSFAVCLRSRHTGDDDYVLEFFLPPSIVDPVEQQMFLDSLLVTMKEHFPSLRVASGKDLDHEWRSIEIINVSSRVDNIGAGPDFGEMGILDCYENVKTGNVKVDGNMGNVEIVAKVKDKGKKPERKRGKAEKTISLDVLQQYFAGSLKDAAKSLGVCPTTMKRICRQHGISRWPSRKINKVNRSLSKLKCVIESVQGGDGTFSLTSLGTNSIPVAVGSITWAANLNGKDQETSPRPETHEDSNELLFFKTNGQAEGANRNVGDGVAGTTEKLGVGYSPGGDSNRSRTGSGSRDESIGTPTSQGSCQNDQIVSPINEHQSTNPREIDFSAAFSMPNDFTTTPPHEPFGELLVEDAGSSHDLINLCPLNEPQFDDYVTENSFTRPPFFDTKRTMVTPPNQIMPQSNEVKTITIKATYREDIIRFRLSTDSGIFVLKEEVAKRLKLETGTFDIKYFDDDHEWVLIACDADLRECVDVSRSSGGGIIRLLVHDIMANLGSSCESSGE